MNEPQSFKGVQQSKYTDKWMAAFEEEYSSQMDNKFWELISPSQLSAECVPIRQKWIGKYKSGYGDVPSRFNGRLTAVGCAQRPGIGAKNLEMVQIYIKTLTRTSTNRYL